MNPPRWLAAGLLAVAAACSGDGDPASSASSPDRASGPAPTSHVVTSSTIITSGVSVATQGAPASSVEVRVSEILSELESTTSAEGTVVSLPEAVLFDFDRADLKAEAVTTIAKLAEVIAFYADAPVSIRGYTDAKGDDAYNLDLSQRRARSVRDALVGRGVDGGRLSATGFGEADPVAPNTGPGGVDNAEGRARNRRVEVVLEGVSRR